MKGFIMTKDDKKLRDLIEWLAIDYTYDTNTMGKGDAVYKAKNVGATPEEVKELLRVKLQNTPEYTYRKEDFEMYCNYFLTVSPLERAVFSDRTMRVLNTLSLLGIIYFVSRIVWNLLK